MPLISWNISDDIDDDFSAWTNTTGRLSVGGSVRGNIERGRDEDWFKVHLTAGQRVTFNLEGSPTNQGTLSDPYLRGIYDSTGHVNLQEIQAYENGTDQYNSRVTFTAPYTGDYFVEAGGYRFDLLPFSSTGSYRLSATLTDDFSATTSTTGRVSVGGSVQGEIENVNDVDWFRIDLMAGQQVTFDLEGSTAGQGTLLDTHLKGIYDSSGTLVSSSTLNDDRGSGDVNSRVSFTAPRSGTYYIAAGGYDSHIGTYRLSASGSTSGSGTPISELLSNLVYSRPGHTL